MDMPTPCPECGETKDFSEFRHNPTCDDCLSKYCDNMICDKCYWKLLEEVEEE